MMFTKRDPGAIRPNDTIWSLPLDVDVFGANATGGPAVIERLTADVAGKDCIHIVHNNATAGSLGTTRKIAAPASLGVLRGSEVTIRFLLKGNAIGTNWNPYCLIKGASAIFGANPLYYNTVSVAEASMYGTFDWKEINYTFELNDDFIPEYFSFGVTAPAMTSGEAWIAAVRITATSPRDADRPAPGSYVQTLSGYRGMQLNPNPPRKDFFDLKQTYNANLVRFQFNTWSATDNPQLTDKTDMVQWDAWFAAKLVTFANARAWAQQNDLKMIVSMMVYPGGADTYSVSQMQYNSQWYMKYIETWKTIATLCLNDPVILAFDVHNEPAYGYRMRPQGPSTSFWNAISDVIGEIRKIDPTRTCIVESKAYAEPSQYRYMRPFPYNNIVYSYHMYRPTQFAQSTTLTYPGFVINSSVQKAVGWVDAGAGHTVDKAFLKDIMQPVRDFQLAYNVPIYVGEFSSPRWTLGCAQYLADCISIFEEWGWIWTYHAFREANSWDVEYEALPASQVGAIVASTTTDRGQVLIDGLAVNVSKYTPAEQTPIAPTLSVVETWNDSLTLNWVPGKCSISSFSVDYKVSADQTWTQAAVARDVTSRNYTGLTPGVSYDFRVVLTNAHGTATSTTLTITKGLSYLLSNVAATPFRAYSIRQVRSAYTGPIIRVRRSSDSTEQDIGAIASGADKGFLDTSALLAFVGAGNGFLTKWYDQSGNAYDLIQATPARQPRIVNAGVVDLVNSFASPSFAPASTQYMVDAHAGLYAAGSATMIGVARNNASAADTYIACESHATVATQFYAMVSGSARAGEAKMSVRNDAGTIFLGNGSTVTVNGFLSGTLRQFVLNDTGAALRVASNIATEVQDTAYTRAGNTVTLNQFALGCRLRGTGADKYANMNMTELVCFASSISQADKDAIKANQVRAFSLV